MLLVFLLPLADEVEYNNCSDGQIRLSSGSSPLEGRLEVCYGRTWFGVCGELYNSFGKPQSICRLLEYSDKGWYLVGNYFIF